ncbi:protein ACCUMULATION AND REPLICATION OF CHLOROPLASTS 3, chloroplastic isoform X2 [Syzygium oleosum]|uniref:protein ACCUMULATION AND REPLICATION OF CHLOROPLASTS 3, chloroplastic isoform X2 n=1 Tax=Syzygium oleosum TaxID=219896 RepID=UPI0024BBD60C|nr:protein ACCUMULATION AND REPLICATION OF CHLOROPLASTS 3, chloroplastic isoform X2 [Syzygium oleosum]
MSRPLCLHLSPATARRTAAAAASPPPSLRRLRSHCLSFPPSSRRERGGSGERCEVSGAGAAPFSVRVRLNGEQIGDDERVGGGGGDAQFVEVIGVGSRKDAVLDFCLDSPFGFESVRFWNIIRNDPTKVLLQQRTLEKDASPSLVEAPHIMQSSPKAIILVAGAGYGLDHTIALDILRRVKSANGFAVAVFLKPFSFEGRRRQDEVKDLVDKLKGHTTFCINIDTDLLLQKDLVTLDEAVRTANNAVLLAINAISILTSDVHKKHLDLMQNSTKELKITEVMEALERCKEGKIGFGSGYNIKTSILQAIYDCPFLSHGVEDFNGIVICILTSSGGNQLNLKAFLETFRQVTKYQKEVIVSVVQEPTLEANVLVTTVVTVGHGDGNPRKSSILSRLAQSFPFVLNLFGKQQPQLNGSQGKSYFEAADPSQVTSVLDLDEVQSGVAVNSRGQGSAFDSGEPESSAKGESNEIYSSRYEQGEVQFSESNAELRILDDRLPEGSPSFQREPLNSWNFTPGYEVAREWARERAHDSSSSMLNTMSVFQLPVGVKPSNELKDSQNIANSVQNAIQESENVVEAQSLDDSSASSWSGLADVGFGAVKDFYDAASTLIQGKRPDVHQKQGNLSARAASMLEAERSSPKTWNPNVEMKYRGGIYRGRCQGGLPEGKGRLVVSDGSIYDGMWRYGKKSGSGTYCFSNGDVFQGSWRDDVMHGKGWFYFHTGDRWFANFWKGKANGEGRFYTKSGDVWFGQFEDGWRHGRFLCIEVNGDRYLEIWDQGVLLSHTQLDSDNDVL